MAGGSTAYYLLKLFVSRPARWLDRIAVALIATAPALGHVEIAKRRLVMGLVGCFVGGVGSDVRE